MGADGDGPGPSPELTRHEFDALFESVKAWGRWGEDDERGALNLITAERVAAAARLVRDGTTVHLGLPLDTHESEHNPAPAVHRMTLLPDTDIGLGSIRFVKDAVEVDYHNDGHSHMDALCHVTFRGALYDGRPADRVSAEGAGVNAIDAAESGLVGRGVLLDIPAVRGVPWLEPGESVSRADLEAAEESEGTRVGEGDVLLVRTGHVRRLAELGSWDTSNAKAGLHPAAATFLVERGIAALGSDGNNDTAPGTTEGVAYPIHVLAIVAMGVHLLDYLDLEDLRAACETAGRWEFLFVAAPLRIEGGTGSPVNPIAIL